MDNQQKIQNNVDNQQKIQNNVDNQQKIQNNLDKQNDFDQYNMQDHNIDYDKELNSLCICGTGLPWKRDIIIMIYPCEHLYHNKCLNKVLSKQKNKCEHYCEFCGTSIEKKYNLFDKTINHQRFADILSMTHYDDMSVTTIGRFLDSLFDLASIIVRVPFITDYKSGKELCEQIFAMNNMTLKVYGLDKIKLEKNKVYISNHVSHIELIVIYYLLGTGFLASNIIGNSPMVEKIKQIVPLMTFERGDKNRKVDIIEKMKEFVDEKGSICLFPEGMMKHPDTLTKFRSGAFHINRPVYAITIRHNDIISDGYVDQFVYKLSGKRDIAMEVYILGPYYPPFDQNKIEEIRMEMALRGNMVLSRVSNRDVKDKKER